MISGNPSFEEAVSAFQEFLLKCGKSKNILWIGPEHVLLTGKPVVYVHIPLAEPAAEIAREIYQEGISQGRGIKLEMLCEVEGAACCHVWVPKDDQNAQHAMVGKELKLSVRTDESMRKPVRRTIQWMWMRWPVSGQANAQGMDIPKYRVRNLNSFCKQNPAGARPLSIGEIPPV